VDNLDAADRLIGEIRALRLAALKKTAAKGFSNVAKKWPPT
jgi:hypothetical protein